MSYYITRIFNNKLKLGVILFIFAAPILDVLKALIDVSKGAAVPFGIGCFLGVFYDDRTSRRVDRVFTVVLGNYCCG